MSNTLERMANTPTEENEVNILMNRRLFMLLVVSIVVLPLYVLVTLADEGNTSDDRLYGTWQTTHYNLNGTDYEMAGLMIITPSYFIGNTIFTIGDQTAPSANANSGPYVIIDGKIVITQWMQLHWRPNDEKENFLTQGVVEEIPYRFEDGNLIFFFPSGNRYVSRRLE
jgi:hypothetical protein